MKMIGVKLFGRVGDDTDFQEFDLLKDVYRIEMSKKSIFRNLPYPIPDKVPIFHTKFGSYITITTIHTFKSMLALHGYEMLNQSDYVNTSLVDEFKRTPYGGIAVLKDGSVVNMSEPMTEKYAT